MSHHGRCGYPQRMTLSVRFVGTATTILRIGSFTLLTDPNFLHREQFAYLGYGLASRRLTEPALQPHQLPPLDAVVLSHLHGDHFDRVARRGLPRDLPIVTTAHGARRLDRWGFTTHVLENWQTHRMVRGDETLTVVSVPAAHAFGVLGRLLPPVMGSVLEYVAGPAPGRCASTSPGTRCSTAGSRRSARRSLRWTSRSSTSVGRRSWGCW